MELRKIIAIKNIGRFLNSSASGDVSLRKYNLVFAENGRGKTTLCSILRSLQTADPTFVIGRKTLGSANDPEVKLLLDSGSVNFANGAWDGAADDLVIFDAQFVAENVYSGDAVDTEHRRSLYRVIIGGQNVELARRIEQLDADIRTKNTEIREARAAVERHIPNGLDLSTFLQLPKDDELDSKIEAKEKELQGATRTQEIRSRPGLTQASLPDLPGNFLETLGRTLEDVATDAEAAVAAHIESHKMAGRGEAWINEGMQYSQGATCPFCGQELANATIIAAYRTHFSAAYRELKRDAGELSSAIQLSLTEGAAARFERVIATNQAATEFWRQYCDLALLNFAEPEEAARSVDALRVSALALAERKAASPLDAVMPDEAFEAALKAFEKARSEVSAYNEGVDATNVAIESARRALGAADSSVLQAEISRLRATKDRHTREAEEACAAYRARESEKTVLEQQKTATRQQLDQNTAALAERYEDTINRYLDRFNAGFRLVGTGHSFRGGTPSSSYRILINRTEIDLGDVATPLDRPSFKNTLSSGDRSTLALAFFLAQLDQDQAIATKVVVFDDPFTSLDSFRRSHTAQQVKRCGQTCSQVILLSHDPTFLKLVWDRLPPGERKTLQLARIDEENTTIAEWDVEKAVQARYRADIDALQAFRMGEGNPREIVQKLRPVLEGYCRNLYPSQFSDQDTLGVIVGKIRAAGGAHPLFAILDDLEDTNDYCRRYHHGESPNAALEPIDDGELHGFVRRVLVLAGAL